MAWVSHRTASFSEVVRVADDDEILDVFAPFVAGFVMQDPDVEKAIRVGWREVCRALCRHPRSFPSHLLFSSPKVIAVFTQFATTLPELMAQVPLASGDKTIKNREARLRCPASIFRPIEVRQIQQCVQWALKYRFSLPVVGGSHSGHCLWPHVVSVDMGAFNQVHIIATGQNSEHSGSFVVAEAGCTTEDIVRKTIAVGLTVPLGARPSVGAGLWLQGGIGHLTRLHGLSCDAVVGAVMVSVDSNRILYVGYVPSQHLPVGAVRPENEVDLLWAMKGAGTNFGIVVSVTFKAFAAPTYFVRSSTDRLYTGTLRNYDEGIARRLPRNRSADAYLYWDKQLIFDLTEYEVLTPPLTVANSGFNGKAVDGVDLFETGMHGGHSGGKTSSFKRCLFFEAIDIEIVAQLLVDAVENCESPLCYLHLLQGGGAVADVADDATAFGCRDWEFACVITGVWPRDQDGTAAEDSAVQWVYDTANDLLPLSSGTYGADLGPDPRDAVLAAKAFGPNLPRLVRLKASLDPHNVLAYACPIPKGKTDPMLIILVTGESCAGKDYCADI